MACTVLQLFQCCSGAKEIRTDNDAKQIVKFVVYKTACQTSLVVT
jgi:hypothetical protein